MVSFKLFIVSSILVLFANCELKLEDDDKFTYYDATKSIEDMRRAVDTTANYGTQIVEMDILRLRQFGESKDDLKLRYELYFSIIDELSKTAAKHTVDVDECLVTYPNLTANYNNLVQFQTENCTVDITDYIKSLAKATHDVGANIGRAYTLVEKLSNCSNNDIDCINQVTRTARSYGKLNPISMVNTVSEKEIVVYRLVSGLPGCQESIINGLQVAVKQAGVIMQCLTDIIQPQLMM